MWQQARLSPWLGVTVCGVCAVVLAIQSVSARPAAQSPGALPNPYRTVENPLTLPAGRTLGWVMGIDIDRNGRDIWVLDTCGGGFQACVGSMVAPVLKFDASGTFIKSFGAGLFVHPHGLYVDADGHVWVIDGFGGNVPDTPQGHQLFKFSPEGTLLMTVGTAGVKGNGPTTFNTLSDVLVAPGGNIFVADGHGGDTNERVVKFTSEGTFVKAWGGKGAGPGQFDTVHSLAMDSRGRLFVGDRSNLRIQIFDQEGTFLEEWRQFGAPSEVFIDENDVIYVADSISDEKSNPAFSRGIRIGSAKDGTVTSFIPDAGPNRLQELVVADAAGNVWAGLLAGQAVKKFVKE